MLLTVRTLLQTFVHDLPLSLCSKAFQVGLNPTNFRLPNLKELADDNFKLDENNRKFFKLVENTVGKGEIARYEQFLLFPQCFQQTSIAVT